MGRKTGVNAIERNRAIVREYRKGAKQVEIAKMFNVSRQCVNVIVQRFGEAFDNPVYEAALKKVTPAKAMRDFNSYRKGNKEIAKRYLDNKA